MKKILVLLVLLISVTYSYAQRQVKVTLKNGTAIIGEAKSFDPLSSIVLLVAGIESTIPMDKVAQVEELKSTSETSEPILPTGPVLTPEKPLVVTDNASYPDSVVVNIAGDPYTFILVKGGDYLMGYDGKGSRLMYSVPVHPVRVTSFYISRDLLSIHTANKLQGRDKDNFKPFKTFSNKKIKVLNELLSQNKELPLRLVTEAEWEYAARGDVRDLIFIKGNNKKEVCLDMFNEFTKGNIQTDPVCEAEGGNHVIRKFEDKEGLPYKRMSVFMDEGYLRLAFKAKDLKTK